MDAELLERIDQTIRKFPEVKDRFSGQRCAALTKLRQSLVKDEALTLDMLLTMRAMRKALDKEIQIIQR
jgi:hypothetical protein